MSPLIFSSCKASIYFSGLQMLPVEVARFHTIETIILLLCILNNTRNISATVTSSGQLQRLIYRSQLCPMLHRMLIPVSCIKVNSLGQLNCIQSFSWELDTRTFMDGLGVCTQNFT